MTVYSIDNFYLHWLHNECFCVVSLSKTTIDRFIFNLFNIRIQLPGELIVDLLHKKNIILWNLLSISPSPLINTKMGIKCYLILFLFMRNLSRGWRALKLQRKLALPGRIIIELVSVTDLGVWLRWKEIKGIGLFRSMLLLWRKATNIWSHSFRGLGNKVEENILKIYFNWKKDWIKLTSQEFVRI